MAKKELTVIQLPEWDGWRVAGRDTDWQVQEHVKTGGKDNGERWVGVRFYGAAHHALGEAYERHLGELGETFADVNEWLNACERVKRRLVDAVKRAVAA